MKTELPLTAFLASSEWIDWECPAVQAEIARLGAEANSDEVARAERAFRFVRDEVAHSWDIQSSRVTCAASDVLMHRDGICYAKSHLLAALLRGMGIPAGICYQKLVLFDDPKDGYCLHALNTIYLVSLDRWIRVDARGNKPGIDAQFSLNEERLAFPVRPEFGEIDYAENFAAPHPKIIAALTGSADCRTLCQFHLPAEL